MSRIRYTGTGASGFGNTPTNGRVRPNTLVDNTVDFIKYRQSRKALAAGSPGITPHVQPTLEADPPAIREGNPVVPVQKDKEKLVHAPKHTAREQEMQAFLDSRNRVIQQCSRAGSRLHGEIVIDDEIRALVVDLIVSGATLQQIANTMNVSIPTVRKHFSYELENALVIQNALISRHSARMAEYIPLSNTFWQKAFNGKREKDDVSTNTVNQGVSVVVHVAGVDADL